MASTDNHNAVVTPQSASNALLADGSADAKNALSAIDGTYDPPSSGIRDTVPGVKAPGSANGTDVLSVVDTLSFQDSFADGDSLRVGASVTDALDANMGSDTDTSKADGLEQRDAGDGSRAAAAKRPTTFKAVSVSRNFLAKAATTSPATKLSDRSTPASSSPLSVARPRLVAKAGSGLRDTVPLRASTEGADGVSVWNKNRPAPAAPPKHFTDEELKQQYGIHLASRIQADETSKAPKWADLDDEEDDWAPEPVEWMDGTKSNMNPGPAVEQPKQAANPAPQTREVEQRPNMMALKRPSTTGPPKTILRPGTSQLAKQETLKTGDGDGSQAGQSKAAAPIPVKSPWATLPPVDKSGPIMDFSAPAPPSTRPTYGRQDARMLDDASPSIVRHEMEADTFDRAWRDADRGPRELFNSHSGRYEPAPEGRRGSMRQDSGYRQPAVLHRPTRGESSEVVDDDLSQAQMRSQIDGSGWSHRRGSSIKDARAQESERRVSFAQPQEQPPISEQRTGIVIGHDIRPQSKVDLNDAERANKEVEDRNAEIARQRKIMLEKREAAIHRRREEEERAEAEKRERLRLKLESLGPAPSKSSSQEVADAADTKPNEGGQAASAIDQAPIAVEQQLCPERAESRLQKQADRAHQRLGRSANRPSGASITPTPVANDDPFMHQDSPINSAKVPMSSYSSPGERKAQPANFKSPSLGQEGFTTWGARTTPGQSQASSVWGAPGALRHIGNGAFDDSFSRIPPRLQGQYDSAAVHVPYGAVRGVRSPSAGTRQETSPMRHQQMLSDQNMAALGLVDTPSEIYPPSLSTGPSPMPGQTEARNLPPIAPPPRSMHQEAAPVHPAARGVSPWSHLAGHDGVSQPDEHRIRSPHDIQAIPVQQQQRWKETFKQTKTQGNWNGAPREIVNAEQTLHGDPYDSLARTMPSPLPPVAQTQQPSMAPILSGDVAGSTVRLPTAQAQVGPPSAAQAPTRSSTQYVVTSSHQSRFFPASAHGSPPPEERQHPVHSGERSRIVVNLPHPKPNVRLPPSSVVRGYATDSSPVTMPERPSSVRPGAQPLVQTPDWQARFNGLFGRVHTTATAPPSPPKTPPKTLPTPSPAPISFTKVEYEDFFSPASPIPATVSLPNAQRSRATSATVSIVLQPLADELFDGELSFGSTPKISIPSGPDYQFAPDRQGIHILRMRPSVKYDKPVVPSSRGILEAEQSSQITVHTPGSAEVKQLTRTSVQTPTARSRKASAKSAGKIGTPTKSSIVKQGPQTPLKDQVQVNTEASASSTQKASLKATKKSAKQRSASAKVASTPAKSVAV